MVFWDAHGFVAFVDDLGCGFLVSDKSRTTARAALLSCYNTILQFFAARNNPSRLRNR